MGYILYLLAPRKMIHPLVEKIPNMICAGIMTGILLEILLPQTAEYDTLHNTIRKTTLVGGICLAGALAFIRY